MTGPVRLDLHVHSAHSPDSSLRLEEIVGYLPRTGLRGFALTDHNTVAGHRELALLAARHPEFLLLPGVEVSTLEGHLLVYGVGELPPIHRPVAETIAWAREHGGTPVLAHPFRLSHGVGRAISRQARVPAVEVVNGHTSARANASARRVAADRKLGVTGGSDVHVARDLGRAYTDFPASASTPRELLDALASGLTSAGGRSLTWSGRLRVGARTIGLLARRGFRPI